MERTVPLFNMLLLAVAAVVITEVKSSSPAQMAGVSESEVHINNGVACSDLVPLSECKVDQASAYPTDGQSVYLGSNYGFGWWRYPTWDSWVRHAQHNQHSITDTEYSWAKWIWHKCAEDYVCLESGKYPDYYLYRSPTLGHGIAYSASPQHAKWAWLRIDKQWNDTRGLFMHLVGERWYEKKDYSGIPVYIYIPPRCDGYRKILSYSNKRSEPETITYSYERGVSQSITHHSSSSVPDNIITEVITSIIEAALSGSFSFSWQTESVSSYYEKITIETTATVKPNKNLVIWQKAASYGHYLWQSGVYFVTCEHELSARLTSSGASQVDN